MPLDDYMPFQYSDEYMAARRKKIDVIGTMLEEVVIRDPYKALNSQQNLPSTFINQKLYGKGTKDDPVNNINLVK